MIMINMFNGYVTLAAINIPDEDQKDNFNRRAIEFFDKFPD
jgi:hypothetical protein